jgi:hypothetical protein
VPRLVLTVLVVAALVSACASSSKSSGPAERDLGIVHTTFGDAHAYCGGRYTESCRDSAAIQWKYCRTEDGKAIAFRFHPGTGPKEWERDLDRYVKVTLRAGAPPNGGSWTRFSCVH